MPVIAIANPKGGAGKSTLSTHIAAYWARQGHAVMLGDIDRQQSSRLWLQLRPAEAAPIATWQVQRDFIVRPPPGATHVVLDTPAGLDGIRLKEIMRMVSKVLVPVQPGIFDIYATRDFIEQLGHIPGTCQIALVGMRVDERTIAAEQLRQFFQSLDLPVLGMLRPTQNYVQLAARGLTIFDLPPSRVARDLQQWQPICQWLDA